ncbi:MAG: helix-turn-helix transcriptional regulator [Lachnospiraceae bacterium]|nr:helix-turn-helix transcriptional regulator [Lachnospiraceae bacterium]
MGDRIKQLRKELELTQEEFSGRLGIKRNTVAQYEIGRNEPQESVISLICREYNVSKKWLLTGEGEMFAKLDPDEELYQWAEKILSGQSGDFRQRFVRLLARLSDVQWKQLEEFALFLAGMDVKPEVDPEQEIQDEVADYERQLRLEKEVEGKSSASESTSGTA